MRIVINYIVGLFLITVTPAVANLNVVATTSIIGDWVENVGGEKIELKVLAGRNTDTHTYEPTPKDAAALARADLIFENGLGLEFWLNFLYKSVSSTAKRVVLGDNLKNLISVCEYHDSHDPSHCQHNSEYDPHIWLDPFNVIYSVELIAKELSDADPENAAYYESQKNIYISELKMLDAWISKRVEELPVERRMLITNHDTFAYFARRYGFENVENVMGASSTEGVNPSALFVTKIIQTIKRRGIPVVFTENTPSASLVDTVAKEAGLPEPSVLYVESLSKATGPAPTYIDLMRYNVNTIVDSLK